MKYTEGGRLTGSIGGGGLGVWGGYAACNLVFGLETAGTMLGTGGEYIGNSIYEVIEND